MIAKIKGWYYFILISIRTENETSALLLSLEMRLNENDTELRSVSFSSNLKGRKFDDRVPLNSPSVCFSLAVILARVRIYVLV